MKNIALLVGNGVNSLSKGISWKELLAEIIQFCDCPDLKDHEDKPFPLFYEEIFLTWVKKNPRVKEAELKQFIAGKVLQIEPNEVHQLILAATPAHVMTVNYEFLLEGGTPERHSGLINETLYSIFRQYLIDGVTYWHLHGDCKNAMSINLGYEHYSGQLQRMRNYMTANIDYKSKKLLKTPLSRRLKDGNGELQVIQSWIDLFFVKDVHIIGLTLDFVETDLWWLLTYRARQKVYKQQFPVKNEICYYIPEEYAQKADFKLKLLEANEVKVVVIEQPHGLNYYKEIIERLK